MMMQIFVLNVLMIPLIICDELLSVQIVWRHGARNAYFCNWGCDDTTKPEMYKLTPAGMRQHYMLGQWLRKQYVETGFLSSTFNENEIYIQSSDSDRTLISAYSNLQGMYPDGPNVPNVDENYLLPPNPGSVKPIDINQEALPNKIQVIPIHTLQNEKDHIMYLQCPKVYAMAEKENMETDLFMEVNKGAQPLIEQFNREMKQNLNNVIQLYEWRDTFICNRFNGEALPPTLTAETLKKVDDISALGFSLKYCQTYDQGRLLTTPFFEDLNKNFDLLIAKESKYKYRAYSAHDSTILSILTALNLTSSECQKQWYFGQVVDNPNCIYTYPDFATNIIFELYNNTDLNQQYIKVMHNGTYVNICYKNGKSCQYTIFKHLLNQQKMNYEEGCGIESDIMTQTQIPNYAIALFSVLCAFTLLLLICVFLLARNYNNKRGNQIPNKFVQEEV